MCPYKKVNCRKNVIPWLTPEIYKAIREKKASVKKYKTTKDPDDLKKMCVQRNKVNSLIDRAKAHFIQTALQQTVKKNKKFWRLLKNLIDSDDAIDITAYIVKSPITGLPLNKDDTSAFLNDYFVNIAARTCGPFVPNLNHYNIEHDC